MNSFGNIRQLSNQKQKTNVKSQGHNINSLMQELEQSIQIIDEDGPGRNSIDDANIFCESSIESAD